MEPVKSGVVSRSHHLSADEAEAALDGLVLISVRASSGLWSSLWIMRWNAGRCRMYSVSTSDLSCRSRQTKLRKTILLATQSPPARELGTSIHRVLFASRSLIAYPRRWDSLASSLNGPVISPKCTERQPPQRVCATTAA